MSYSKQIVAAATVGACFIFTGNVQAQTQMKTLDLKNVKATFMVPADFVADKDPKPFDYILENDDFLVFVSQIQDEEFDFTLQERMKDDDIKVKTEIKSFNNGNVKGTYTSAVTVEDGEKELKMYINAQSVKNPNDKIELDILVYDVNESTIQTANKILSSITFLDNTSYKSFSSKSTSEKVEMLSSKVEEAKSGGIGKAILSTAIDVAADFIPGGKTIKGLFNSFFGGR